MLADNFDGRRFTVPSHDGTNLDCMFFPVTDEKVKTCEEMTEPLEYLSAPTIIYFNPNAMHYQGLVHNPNAFWLKYFFGKGINVFVWNYRNYGRSEGSPDPYCTLHDGEAVLKFLV